MKRDFSKLRLFVSYFMILLVIFTYVFSNSYTYSLEVTQNDLETSISTLSGEIEDLTMQIDVENSRDKILKQDPDLKINNNVYYLENTDGNKEN